MRAAWPRDSETLRRIRQRVFIDEQKVPAEVEWDGTDSHCDHVLILDDNGDAVATGRLQPDGKIGRMAVVPELRRRGYGAAILTALINIAHERGLAEVYLHAQTHAMAFYARYGFVSYGNVFEEAGIPHHSMKRAVSP